MRVLAVGAHPDDVEVGCGGTLLRHHTRGDEITILVMTGGERGVYDARSRRNEQQCAALLAGATLVWGGYKDGAVPQGPDAISVVDRVVDKYGAEVLYTHAPGDSHQDHRATSSISLAAARRVPTVLYYETPSTIDFVPTVFIDLEDLMERKIGLVREHLSQVLRDGPVELDALVAQARFRGSQGRTRHAEAFRPARFLWDLLERAHQRSDTRIGAPARSSASHHGASSDQQGRERARPMKAAPGATDLTPNVPASLAEDVPMLPRGALRPRRHPVRASRLLEWRVERGRDARQRVGRPVRAVRWRAGVDRGRRD